MNRRSFLSSFLKSAAVAIAAPQILTHGFNLKRIVVPTAQESIAILNPDWANAPYEISVIWHKHAVKAIVKGVIPIPKGERINPEWIMSQSTTSISRRSNASTFHLLTNRTRHEIKVVRR